MASKGGSNSSWISNMRPGGAFYSIQPGIRCSPSLRQSPLSIGVAACQGHVGRGHIGRLSPHLYLASGLWNLGIGGSRGSRSHVQIAMSKILLAEDDVDMRRF